MRYPLHDWLGSARGTEDATSTTTYPNAYLYDGYGREIAYSGAATTNQRYGGAWGYQSEVGTEDGFGTGLVYTQQRYYDPETGGFVSPDPIGFAGGLNLYAYCGEDPIGCVDPSGQDGVGVYLVRGFVNFFPFNAKFRGLPMASDLLMHSLQDHPQDLGYRDWGDLRTSGGRYGDEIRHSPEYKNLMSDIMNKIKNSKTGKHCYISDLKFFPKHSLDLFFALHNTTAKYCFSINEWGDWILDVTISDLYNYEKFPYNQGKYGANAQSGLNILAGILANTAFEFQQYGAIVPYNFSISMRESGKR